MGKTRKMRRFIEKLSCWKMFGLLCWLSGFGGVLLSTIGGLSIYKPDIPLPFIDYVLPVIGTIVFLMTITGIRIRSQWSSTLMEIRGIKERTKGTSSNDELLKLTEILVGFMSSMESSSAQFNGMNMLTGRFAQPTGENVVTGSMWFHIGSNMDQRVQVFIGTMSAAALGVRELG